MNKHPLNAYYKHAPTGAVVKLYAVEMNPDAQRLHYEGADDRGCVFKGMLEENLTPVVMPDTLTEQRAQGSRLTDEILGIISDPARRAAFVDCDTEECDDAVSGAQLAAAADAESAILAAARAVDAWLKIDELAFDCGLTVKYERFGLISAEWSTTFIDSNLMNEEGYFKPEMLSGGGHD